MQLTLTPPSEEALDRARAFIAAYGERAHKGWAFARTMPDSPHEYAVRERAAAVGLEAEFEWFVMLVREHGYERRWGSRTFTYLNVTIDGVEWRLWSMGNPLPETTILNRTPTDEAAQAALRAAHVKPKETR